MRSWLYSGFTGLTLLCISCINQSEYELDGITLNPTYVFPLAKGNLSINNILSDKDSVHFKSDESGLLYVSYEDGFETQNIRELFDIPAKTLSRSFVMPGLVLPPHNSDIRTDSITSTVDFGLSPEKISEIALHSGHIDFTTSLNPNSNLNYEVHVIIPGFKSRITNKSLNVPIRGADRIDLKDYTLSITDNKFDVRLVLVFRRSTSTTVIAPATSVNVKLDFGGFEFTYLKGFFGDQTVSLDPQTVGISVFDNNIFEQAQISLAQPRVTFTVTNENGVPCTVTFGTLEARKPGAAPLKILLNPANPVPIAYPTVLGDSKGTTITVANVKELIDYAPNELHYSSDVRLNAGITSGNNFIIDSSAMKVRLNIEVPLWGSATGLTLQDTLDVDLENTETSEVVNASLKVKIINQFPLDGDVQFVLTDANYTALGTLLLPTQTKIIKGSTVDSDGELQAAGSYTGTIELDKTKIDNIFKAKHIIIVANLQTSRNAAGAAVDVKFMEDYFLAVEVGMLASFKLRIE